MMGQRYKNDDVRAAIKNNLYLDGYSDHAPSEISNFIQPIVDVTPNNNRIVNIYKELDVTNTSGTIYTTPTDKDFYLTSCSLSFIKNAGNLSAKVYIAYISASPIYLNIISTLSGTADRANNTITFNTPLLLPRGAALSLASDDATASINISGLVFGYTVDTNIYDSGVTNKK